MKIQPTQYEDIAYVIPLSLTSTQIFTQYS
jgi:hypothetical protein